jgi:hypothetical protein
MDIGYCELPDTPYLDMLTATIGSEAIDKLYFDANLNPKPDAPEELKREIALLRADYDEEEAYRK